MTGVRDTCSLRPCGARTEVAFSTILLFVRELRTFLVFSSRYKLAGTLAIVAIPLATGFWSGWRRQPQGPLEVAATQLDVGIIRTGRLFTHGIVVRNTSSRTVVIPQIDVSGTGTHVTPHDFRVEPGGSVSLELTLDPIRLHHSGQDEKSAAFRIRLALFEQGRPVPQQWILNGTLDPLLVMTPTRLAFYGPHTSVRGERGPTLEATVRLRGKDFVLGVSKLEHFDVVCNQDGAKNGTWRVRVTPQDRRETGAYSATIWLAVRNSKGKFIGEWPLPVAGLVESPITVLPSQLDLFPVKDSQITERVIVHSNAGKMFRVASRSSVEGAIEVRPANNGWAKEHTVELDFESESLPETSQQQIAIEFQDGGTDFATFHVAVHRFEEQP